MDAMECAMECPILGEIRFSQVSIAAIEDIRRRQALAGKRVLAIGAGYIINIFFGNGMLEATYSLYSTDFELMSKGMQAAPLIVRKSIENVADMTQLMVSNHKEKEFWRAVSAGCKVH